MCAGLRDLEGLFCPAVKPNPPHNLSVSSSEELSSILKLTWVNPSITSFMSLKYDIQYRARGASAWTQVRRASSVWESPSLPAAPPKCFPSPLLDLHAKRGRTGGHRTERTALLTCSSF